MTQGLAFPLETVHARRAGGRPLTYVIIALGLGVAIAYLPLWASAGLLLASATVLLALIQPFLGLVLALIAGPLGAVENVVLGTQLPESGQVLFLLFAGAWLANGIRKRRLFLPFTRLNGPLALFVALASLSLLGDASLTYGLKELLKWLEMGLAMLIVVDLVVVRQPDRNDRTFRSRHGGPLLAQLRSPASSRWILAALLLAGLSQALIGIWQFGLRGEGPEHFAILGSFYRAYGTFEQPNPFGGFMAIGGSLALGALLGTGMEWLAERLLGQHRPPSGLIASCRKRDFSSSFDRLASESKNEVAKEQAPGPVTAGRLAGRSWLLFVGVSAAAMLLALLFSWSRGAWLGFSGAMAVLVLLLPKRRWLGLVLLTLIAGTLLVSQRRGLLPVDVIDRLVSFREDLRFDDVRGADINDENYAVLERLAHWQVALDMIRDDVWLGVGFGNYEPTYPQYALPSWPDPLGHAHNYYLNILAETGVLGAAAYLLFWAAVFWQALRLLRRLSGSQRGIALGLVAAWATLTVHHLVDKLYVNNLYIFLGIMLGLQQVLEKTND